MAEHLDIVPGDLHGMSNRIDGYGDDLTNSSPENPLSDAAGSIRGGQVAAALIELGPRLDSASEGLGNALFDLANKIRSNTDTIVNVDDEACTIIKGA